MWARLPCLNYEQSNEQGLSNMGRNPSVMVKKHTGSGGGLFTRRVSEADPLFAERLSAIANHKNLRRNSPAGYQTLSIQNAVLKREEGIGRPRNLSLVS